MLLVGINLMWVVNYWFTPRPWCLGSTARLTLFRLSLYPRSWSTWGLSSILVFYNRDHVPWVAVYSKSIIPKTLPYKFLVSLHIPDTNCSFLDFNFVPSAQSHVLGILALHGGKSCSVIWYFLSYLHLLPYSTLSSPLFV